MNNPYAVLPDSSLLDLMLRLLPDSLNKDPDASAGFALAYDGSNGSVSIAQKQFSTTVTAGTGEALVMGLQGLTLSDLVDFINDQPGYAAALIGNGALPALRLMPVQKQSFFLSPQVRLTNSLLWRILMPITWEFEKQLTFQEQAGQQFVIRSSAGKWLDLWGELYGNIFRLFNEEDQGYAARILREVSRWRLNEFALAELIEDQFGIPAHVRNLHDQAWVWNKTKYGKYAGRKYSRGTFEVDPLIEPDSSIKTLIERNKAAGTLAYYITRIVSGYRRLIRAGAATERIQSILLFGRTAPENRISGVITEHWSNIPETMFGVGGAFTLGTSLLGGADVLGGSGSISLTDTVTGALE